MRPSFGYDTDRMKSVSVRFLFSPSFRLVFIGVVLIGVMLGQGLAHAKSCDEQFFNFESRDALRAKLPRRGTAKYQAMVEKVANELLKTRSYATLDLTSVFTPDFVRRWQMSFPQEYAAQLHRQSILPSGAENIMARSHPAYEAQLVAAGELQTWFRILIQDAVKPVVAEAYSGSASGAVSPNWSRLGEGFAAIRNSTSAEKSILFGEWHPDGGGVSVTLSTKNVGTEVLGGIPLSYVKSGAETGGNGDQWLLICSSCKPFTVPAGHALILLGSGTISRGEDVVFTPTIHRTPSYSGERQLFLFRY